jgi:antitoxin component YwqK of YwqJK toxin-antitoxin module/cytochrome c2
MKFKALLIIVSGGVALLSSFTSSDQQEADYREKVYLDKRCNCFVKETYWNGIKSTYEQVKDTFDFVPLGKYISFYANGDTAAVTIYNNYQKDGIYYNLYEGGQLWGKGRYLADKKEGLWFYLQQSGDTVYKQTFVNDKEHGDGFLKFELGGQTFREYRSYTNGRYSGTWKTYVNNVLSEQTVYDKAVPGKYTVQYYDTVSGGLIYTTVHIKGKKDIQTINSPDLYKQMQWRAANMTGEQIFMVNCASCHHPFKDATGPAMKGVLTRHSEAWVRKWIKNPAAMIAAGDPEAVATFNQWNKTAMTAFPYMPPKEVDKLIAYLNSL